MIDYNDHNFRIVIVAERHWLGFLLATMPAECFRSPPTSNSPSVSYNAGNSLGLTDAQIADLTEYLKSL